MRVSIELSIDFGPPIRLSEIASHKKALQVHGVYVITEGKPAYAVVDPASKEVVYLGKAIKQTVYGRCERHLWSVTDARSSMGKPRSAPGHSFRKYRERIGYDASRLWVTPGVMSVQVPYAISCAEEYLLYFFHKAHGRYPWCNSAGQERET